MKAFDDWLHAAGTCGDLHKLLVGAISQWRCSQEVQPPDNITFPGALGCFRAQQRIGWRQLLGGCLAREWAMVQHRHFEVMGRRRSGAVWAGSMIKELWKMGWAQWEDRNKALHDTPLAADMAGAQSLDVSLQVEWVLGRGTLPAHVWLVFPPSLLNLLAQPITAKKHWFVLVRSHRELSGDGIDDDFTPSRSALRKWVGL